MKTEQHNHDHSHTHSDHVSTSSGLRALLSVIVFTSVVFVCELVGGFLSGSLALLSDAMHMLSDSTGLIVAVVAILIGRRGASAQATYGYKRFEVLAALVNGIAVSAISLWIVYGALRRLNSGADVDTTMMLIVGIIGLVANIFGATVLRSHRDEGMNMEGAFLHVLVDLFGSIAVVVAALVIRFTGFQGADTIASLIIAALILPRSISLIKQACSVILEKAPAGVDGKEIKEKLEALPGVSSVHDFHIWSLDGTKLLATCHIVVNPMDNNCEVLDSAQKVFADAGIEHSTIQLENLDHHDHEEPQCGE